MYLYRMACSSRTVVKPQILKVSKIDCLRFVMCLLPVPVLISIFSFFLLRPLMVLMKQTWQAVHTIKQSILLRCLWIKHSPLHPKVEGLSPAVAAGTRWEKEQNIYLKASLNSKTLLFCCFINLQSYKIFINVMTYHRYLRIVSIYDGLQQ